MKAAIAKTKQRNTWTSTLNDASCTASGQESRPRDKSVRLEFVQKKAATHNGRTNTTDHQHRRRPPLFFLFAVKQNSRVLAAEGMCACLPVTRDSGSTLDDKGYLLWIMPKCWTHVCTDFEIQIFLQLK